MSAYVTVQEADTYFSNRLFSDSWTNASPEDKQKALIMATKAIDRKPLRGRKTDPQQELAFPRNGATEIPQEVKDACCEEALAILSSVGNQHSLYGPKPGLKSIQIGKVREEYFSPIEGGTNSFNTQLRSPEAWELLKFWIGGGVGMR